MIKIGSNLLSLKNTSIEEFIQTAASLRLDCVDFHYRGFTSRDPDYLSNIKYLCLSHGLPVGYIGCSVGFTGTREQRREFVDLCKDAVEIAAFIGSPIIRVFCGIIPAENGDGDDPWPPMIACYQEVADCAAARGHRGGTPEPPFHGRRNAAHPAGDEQGELQLHHGHRAMDRVPRLVPDR